MAELHPYPKEFLLPAKMLVDYVRGDPSVPLHEAIHAGWQLVGFGLAQYDPHTPDVKAAEAHALRSRTTEAMAEEVANWLTPSVGVAQAGVIPWPIIIPIVLEIIRRLLER